MSLAPQGDGKYLANGRKYYIGNANEAALVSTFGKMTDTGDYVFFAVATRNPRFEVVKNIVTTQNFVAEYALTDYPITDADILTRGRDAWDSALNTVNVGKFNLGWASIGICTHAFYEAIDHAANRVLYGKHVTDFPHVRQLFVDAYSRLVAMKLFALRAIDYMRAASPEDRRYLLYNPMVKMKVTTQGEEVINLLWDVIAAKGFEKDMYFEMAARDIRALPKLEGTVHVNMALIIKFMPNYFFNPGEFPAVAQARRRRQRRLPLPPGADQGPGQHPVPRLQPRLRQREPAQREHLPRADRGLQADAAGGRPQRGAAEGHRLPADPGRALHPGGVRPAHPRELRPLRDRGRPARPDLRLHGARLLLLRAAALLEDQLAPRSRWTPA